MAKTRILVVENEAIVAEDIKFKLEPYGYEVSAIACSGEEGVRQAAASRPDLILMDIRMPGHLDGIEAAAEIKKVSDVPVIFLTAFSDKQTVDRAKVLGPFGFITKPFDERELRTAIEIAIYKHGFDKTLRRQAEEIERFTHAVSHDLRSPLVTLKTFLGLLEKDLTGTDQERIKTDWHFLHSAVDKMSSLLNELLELSRIGRKMNIFTNTPLQQIVQEAITAAADQIAARGVAVSITNEPIMLYGDRVRLVAVFKHLVDNAVKFMGEQPEPRVEIGVEKNTEGRKSEHPTSNIQRRTKKVPQSTVNSPQSTIPSSMSVTTERAFRRNSMAGSSACLTNWTQRCQAKEWALPWSSASWKRTEARSGRNRKAKEKEPR